MCYAASSDALMTRSAVVYRTGELDDGQDDIDLIQCCNCDVDV